MGEFVDGFDNLATVTRGVSIFGSARTHETDPMYKRPRETARLLAKRDFEIITGGGPGIMEAANRGAYDAGASVGRLQYRAAVRAAAKPYLTNR